MNIYCIDSVISNFRNRIVFQNNNKRLMDHFVFDDDNGTFLNYIKLSGVPQKNIKRSILDNCDYLQGNIDIPIFSQRFVELMSPFLKNDVRFYPIEIYNDGESVTFYIAKIFKYMDFIDFDKSNAVVARDRENGVFFSSPIVIKPNLSPFLIARDINEPFRWFVSDDFRQYVKKNGLQIKFLNISKT